MSKSASLEPSHLKSARSEIRWPPRVSKSVLRRLYEADAQGIVDAELIDDVGITLSGLNEYVEQRLVPHLPASAGDTRSLLTHLYQGVFERRPETWNLQPGTSNEDTSLSTGALFRALRV